MVSADLQTAPETATLPFTPCQPEHAPQLQALFERNPRYFRRVIGGPVPATEAQKILEIRPPSTLPSDKHLFLLGDPRQPFGVADLIRDYPEPHTAMLGLFVLEEAHQGRGIGTECYAQLERWMRLHWAVRRIRLAVVDANIGAQSFWEKQGFRLSGEVFPYAEGSVRSQLRVMQKLLGGARRPLPVLDGPHFVVRTLRVSDLPAILNYVNGNRTQLAPWEPIRPEVFYTEDYWRLQLRDNLEQFDHDTAVRLGIFLPGRGPQPLIGCLNLNQIARGVFQAGILGYSLDEGWQGRGIMRESLQRLIDYAFQTLNLHRLMANAMPRNHRSLGLLDRLGFVREGYAKDYLRIAGVWEDHVLTALTNPHWQELA